MRGKTRMTEIGEAQDILREKSKKELAVIKLLKISAPAIMPFLVLLAIWQLIVMVTDLPNFILPTPISVWQALGDSARWRWFDQILATTSAVLGGYALGAVLGITIGIGIAWSTFTHRLLMPFLIFFNSLPKIAMAPLFLIWLGFGIIPNMWISFFICFFPIAVNTAVGVSEIDPEMIELGRLFKLSKLTMYRRIRIPHALPYIFAGLKVATSLAVIGVIIGEFIAASKGLAAVIIRAQAILATEAMFGALLWISVLGLGLYGLVSLLQKRIMPWAESTDQQR